MHLQRRRGQPGPEDPAEPDDARPGARDEDGAPDGDDGSGDPAGIGGEEWWQTW